jgi:hypothetical protein
VCEKSNVSILSCHPSLACHDLLDISFSESIEFGVFEAFGWWNRRKEQHLELGIICNNPLIIWELAIFRTRQILLVISHQKLG